MSRFQDLTGRVFGKWTVVELVHKCHFDASGKQHGTIWLCQCDCGTTTPVEAGALNNGMSKSCGCNRTTHGMWEDPLYQIWNGIRQRCFNPKIKNYKRYGFRGITMEPAWKDDFKAFRDWVLDELGPRPTTEHSLDRINNEFGSYTKGNLRWATPRMQGNNQRTNLRVEFRGIVKTLTEWCRELGLPYSTVRQRVMKLGWDIEKALTTPPHALIQR